MTQAPFGKPDRAEIEADPVFDLHAVPCDDLGAAAADINDSEPLRHGNPVRAGDPAHSTPVRPESFLPAAQHLEPEPRLLADPPSELLAVGRVPYRTGPANTGGVRCMGGDEIPVLLQDRYHALHGTGIEFSA